MNITLAVFSPPMAAIFSVLMSAGWILVGALIAFAFYIPSGIYQIGPAERGVITTFGRADRLAGCATDDPTFATLLTDEEKARYRWPNIRVVPPGGPYFRWPWQKLHRVNMTIQTVDITWDPDIDQAVLEAVTKDNLTVSLKGQLRWKPCERNLYAYLFGVSHPAAHVIGYFVSVLRDRIAAFHTETGDGAIEGVSINDLRKNLSAINQFMEEACRKTAARYGVEFDASLVTSIESPTDVEDALASINTTQNQVAAEVSQARADAEQKLKFAEQAVQIAGNRAEAEAAPLRELHKTLREIAAHGGPNALAAYVRNATLPLREKAAQTVVTVQS
jgi:regulator of protease activity HflC (stomatin/prohibitin superfamily)